MSRQVFWEYCTGERQRFAGVCDGRKRKDDPAREDAEMTARV